jgi:hypothetical protein
VYVGFSGTTGVGSGVGVASVLDALLLHATRKSNVNVKQSDPRRFLR